MLRGAGLFLVSGTIQYVGAALAVGLFAVLTPTAVAWWRLAVAALLLLAWRRPWARGMTRRDVVGSSLFGIALATMNVLFYAAIARIPLGAAVSIEFLGPVLVAAVGMRGWRARAAVALAVAGVVLIGGLGVNVADPRQCAGVLWALAAGGAWAAYIILGRRIAVARSGLDSLAVGMAAGAIVVAPVAWPEAGAAGATVPVALAVVGVAIFSSLVPYSLEQVVLTRVSAGTFALLTALLPVTSTLVGAVVLRQVPSPADLVGTVAVSAAVAMSAGRSRPQDQGHAEVTNRDGI